MLISAPSPEVLSGAFPSLHSKATLRGLDMEGEGLSEIEGVGETVGSTFGPGDSSEYEGKKSMLHCNQSSNRA